MMNDAALRFQEGQQVLVDLVLVGRAQAVRGTLVDLQGRALDEFGLELAGGGERHDLVVVTLKDECRHVDLLQIRGCSVENLPFQRLDFSCAPYNAS